MISVLFISILSVFLAEIGDKTQLLTLFLVLRYPKKYSILFAIITSTLINHLLSAYFGVWITKFIDNSILTWIISISFIIVGLWVLIPDKETTVDNQKIYSNVFITSFILFFIAEIGDKTQIATIVLSAKYQSFLIVMFGSALGLLLANVPILWFGNKIMNYIPLKLIRISSCIIFCGLGLLNIFTNTKF